MPSTIIVHEQSSHSCQCTNTDVPFSLDKTCQVFMSLASLVRMMWSEDTISFNQPWTSLVNVKKITTFICTTNLRANNQCEGEKATSCTYYVTVYVGLCTYRLQILPIQEVPSGFHGLEIRAIHIKGLVKIYPL